MDIDYAYLAGLVDGDGHITIINRSKNACKGYRIKLCIYNCNDKIAKLLREKIGGHIRSNNINKLHPKWRNCIVYSCQDGRAAKLIRKIEPYLIIKRAQAKIALEAIILKEQYNGGAGRWHPELKIEHYAALGALKNRINELNIRGGKKQFQSLDVKPIPFNIEYLAGFCDADGSICISKQGKRVLAKIVFANTNKNIIDWIGHHLECSDLLIRKWSNKNWNIGYSISFTCKKAYALAALLYPLLLIKKRQAKLLMTLAKSRNLRADKGTNFRERRKKFEEKLRILCCQLNKRST
jgi:hypothetical protein